MKTIEIGTVTVYWTAWEYGSEAHSGAVWRNAQRWLSARRERSASIWRLSDPEKTRYFMVAVAEDIDDLVPLERRLRRRALGEYAMPTEDVRALVIRRTQDAKAALKSGKTFAKGERHFKGRWALRPDGSLESLDKPQG
jgi:hypothetical protein